MNYLKCEVCGNYDEIPERTIRLHGKFGVSSVCGACIEKKDREQLEYDASECCYDSVEEYLAGENYRKYFKGE
ncbi:gp411 [Bacillus phage G]|uniref:Gp411 n=1 Tax=Bacillus phage G TaxID=2884420 RepID=G3MAF2_9CAUD|nr:gp411 [Bacillus phage G]AEO93669.1 gp411 [Bacillus phage G]